MAKSTGYYGLRRGSTKSHTYQVVNGKQITKDRQEGGKQPRTLAQMKQRCIIATAGSAYAALKSICDHSYEGVSAGLDSMSHFHKVNDSLLRQSALRDNGLFGYNRWGVKGLVAGSYVIAEGTLPQNCPNLQALSVDAVSRKCTIDVAYGRSVAEIAEELGVVNFGDIATIAMIYPKRDGSYGFGAVRLTYKQGEDVAASFELGVIGDFTGASMNYATGNLTVEVQTAFDWKDGADADACFTAAILSRYMNGKWYRSKAQFDVTGAVPSFGDAIATYPVGQPRFLNGSGSVEPSANPSTPSDPTPVTPSTGSYSLVISKTGTGVATVSVGGSEIQSGAQVEAGAQVSVELEEPANATAHPYAQINGQSVSLTENDGVFTGTFTMPSVAATLTVFTGSVAGGGSDQN